jgi:hypothetical protein
VNRGILPNKNASEAHQPHLTSLFSVLEFGGNADFNLQISTPTQHTHPADPTGHFSLLRNRKTGSSSNNLPLKNPAARSDQTDRQKYFSIFSRFLPCNRTKNFSTKAILFLKLITPYTKELTAL